MWKLVYVCVMYNFFLWEVDNNYLNESGGGDDDDIEENMEYGFYVYKYL